MTEACAWIVRIKDCEQRDSKDPQALGHIVPHVLGSMGKRGARKIHTFYSRGLKESIETLEHDPELTSFCVPPAGIKSVDRINTRNLEWHRACEKQAGHGARVKGERGVPKSDDVAVRNACPLVRRQRKTLEKTILVAN